MFFEFKQQTHPHSPSLILKRGCEEALLLPFSCQEKGLGQHKLFTYPGESNLSVPEGGDEFRVFKFPRKYYIFRDSIILLF
jgi:hypothetical protein